ncbi:hypothetical protein D3C84_909860 [compost metagenome]
MEAVQLGQSAKPLLGEVKFDLSEVAIPVRQHDEKVRRIAIALPRIYPSKGVRLRVVPYDLGGILQPNAVRRLQN